MAALKKLPQAKKINAQLILCLIIHTLKHTHTHTHTDTHTHTHTQAHKLSAIDLCKQQVLNADPKEMEQINFMGILKCAGNTTVFIIIEVVKETTLDFLQGTVKVL